MTTLANAAAHTRRDTRGIAAVEFAIMAPFLMMMLGGLIDYSLALWSRGVLANSVAQGTRYAFLVGENVLPAKVKTVVQQTLSLLAADVVVTGPGCYCITGTPPAAAARLCTLPCADGTSPGSYLKVVASYTYKSQMPVYSMIANPVMTEAAWVRLR